MIVRLFDIENDKVVPTEHSYTLKFLKDLRDGYPDDYLKMYQYLFYMTCPNPDTNPFFHVREEEKEELIFAQIQAEFSTELDMVQEALKMCKHLYETPTSRAYKGIKSMLDKLADYMEDTTISHGRDGNLTALVNAASKFEDVRESFKGAYKDLMDEQKSHVRGGHGMAYDQ